MCNSKSPYSLKLPLPLQNGGLSFLEGGGFSFDLPQPPNASAPMTGGQRTNHGASQDDSKVDRPRRERRPQQRSRANSRPEGEKGAAGTP